ncbi:hypothetical protein [Actinokineospora iranica]|uniref:hypothetical protein n=1 Tax=Actinokineospora iranica TaxID=1271860 RepID=UPI0011136BB0|nr:hypothetical protein [Actinokineospora iranica]
MTGTESVRADDRQTLHLTFPVDLTPPPMPPTPVVVSDRPPPERTFGERCLLTAERFLGGWAPTLRLALLLVAAGLAGLVLIGVFAGVVPALISAAVLVVLASRRGH